MTEQQLGPIDIICDAPPYHVVRACNLIGFETPEDVAWRRFDGPIAPNVGGWRKLLRSCQHLFGAAETTTHYCTCGQPLPEWECFSFTFVMNRTLTYRLGQCARCRTIHWQEV